MARWRRSAPSTPPPATRRRAGQRPSGWLREALLLRELYVTLIRISTDGRSQRVARADHVRIVAGRRKLPPPHGEVLAAHWARHEVSDRWAASLEPRTTRIANSLRCR